MHTSGTAPISGEILAPGAAGEGRTPAALRRGHVLIVDDALTVRRYHGSIARDAGLEVSEAADGAEGLEKALAGAFDLVLVDVNMPTMDGYRFLSELRQRPELSAIPAIMISTESAHEDRRLAFAAGANIYLVKPVAPDILKGILHLLLGQAPHV